MADDATRRQWNQVFFNRLFIKPDPNGHPEVVGAEVAEPFAQLLSDDLATAVDQMQRSNPSAFAAGGSNVEQIVELMGRLSNPDE